MHPDIRLCSGWSKSEIMQAISESLISSQSGGTKALECLADTKDMSLKASKFFASNDVDLLLGKGLEIGISNICSPQI